MADEQESIRVGFLGHTFAAKGLNSVVIGLLTLALSAVVFLLWERSNQSSDMVEKEAVMRTQEHTAIVDAVRAVQGVNERITELIDEQNYIVLSDEGERRDMKKAIRRPSSLSKKLTP